MCVVQCRTTCHLNVHLEHCLAGLSEVATEEANEEEAPKEEEGPKEGKDPFAGLF